MQEMDNLFIDEFSARPQVFKIQKKYDINGVIIILLYDLSLQSLLMSLKLFSILLLVCLAITQPNYQERNLYYSQSDQVCYGSDQINLTINLDGKETIKSKLSGKTGCNYWALDSLSMIRPANSTSFVDSSLDAEIKFAQETTHKYNGDQLQQIIQKVTVLNPGKIRGSSYNCVIFGDGKIQHFGIDEDYPPASIYLRCLQSTQQNQLQSNLSREAKNI